MAKAKKRKRTTLHSKAGEKLYAVRDKEGKFKDIQSYKRAHSSDVKRSLSTGVGNAGPSGPRRRKIGGPGISRVAEHATKQIGPYPPARDAGRRLPA